MNVENEISRLISKDETISLLQKLIRIPSPTGEEKTVANFIYDLLKSWSFKTEIFDFLPNRPEVMSFLEGSEARPTLILNGHLDHVPPGDLEDWSYDPYEGRVVAGRIYGRGAADMKGGLTAMIIAAKALKDSGIKLKGDLILTFAVGEEIGEWGTKHIVVDKGIKGDWGIVTEPTVFRGKFRVAVAEKGVAWFRITIKGRASHASQPGLGVNAISKAGKIIAELEKYNSRLASKKHNLIGASTSSITIIEGGFKENVIPDQCKIIIDRRIIPGEKLDEVKKEIADILKKLKRKDSKINSSVELTRSFEAGEIQSNAEIVKIVRKNLKKACGHDSKPWGTPYGTDARNLINDASIPTIVFGPGDISHCHCVNEYVNLNEVINATKVIALTAIELLS